MRSAACVSCVAMAVLAACTSAPCVDAGRSDAGARDAGADARAMDATTARDSAMDATAARDSGMDAGELTLDAGRPPDHPFFTDVTELAGLAAPHLRAPRCILDSRSCETDYMSGGVAVGDVDGDGWPDLFTTMLGGPDHLYRNLGDGTFADVTATAGLSAFAQHSNGAAFVDVDDDGDLDLYVTTIGAAGDPINARYYLFINGGAGTFSEEAVARGLALDDGRMHGGTSIAVGDYDRDGYPDLHVGEWLPGVGIRPHTRLLHNRGGFFQDVTAGSGASIYSARCWDGVVECSTFTFASAFSDLDDDGWPDLVVVNDFGLTRLFWNRGDGTFVLGLRTQDIGGDENGMGSTIGDVDGDGDLDWFVSSVYDPDFTCVLAPCTWGSSGDRLYRYAGERTFEDATDDVGVRDDGWGWGAGFFDADHDGDLDLVATNGVDFPGGTYDDAFRDDTMRFFVNDGRGHMEERALIAGLTDRGAGKGLAVFDYDLDGDLDVFVVDNGAQPHLYRNDTDLGGSFLRVDARRASGAEALGARVWARVGGRTQVREIASVTHFLGQSERVAHFGLGAGVSRVDQVEVRWPSGATTRLDDVAANQTIVLVSPE